MKSEIKEQKPKKFQPFQLIIDVESPNDLNTLYAIFTGNQYMPWCHTDNSEIKKLLLQKCQELL